MIHRPEWPTDIQAARRARIEPAGRVRCVPHRERPRLVAGVDAAFTEGHDFGAACLYARPALKPLEDACVPRKLEFPCLPGFLTFREGPAR